MEKIIAVDLDGVIHTYSKGWHDGTMYDAPVEGSHEALANLVTQGLKVAIVTARLNPKYGDVEKKREDVEEWLSRNGYVKGEHYHELTNNKPAAIAYIDDRAVVFQNWEQATSDLQRFLP